MSISAIPRVMKDFRVYVDGVGYAGEVSEIELPKIVTKTEGLQVGYMSVPVELGIEPMETTITMNEQVKEIFLLWGVLNKTTSNLITFRGYQEGEGGFLSTNKIRIHMRGIFTEIDMGTIKRGEVPQYKIKVKLVHYAYFQDNVPLIVIEPKTNTFLVGGVDQLFHSKNALGIV